MVFQRPNPFPTMSIYENVVAGMKLNGRVPKAVSDDVVEQSLRGANLWNEVKDRLDRPCSALDPISTLAIEDLMEELKKDYTIVIVTHNMQQAARVSDRTAFFSIQATGEPGRLVELDDTQKIFTNPGQKKTEDYITGRFG